MSDATAAARSVTRIFKALITRRLCYENRLAMSLGAGVILFSPIFLMSE